MNRLHQQIKAYISETNSNHILFHTYLLQGYMINLPPSEKLLQAHCEYLIDYGKNVFMPTFNYDFGKTRQFNIFKDKSQVGVINEFFRNHYATWRTPVPFFSFAGTGHIPYKTQNTEINPFDNTSIFNYLHKNDSLIVYYGAGLNSTTFMHYVEEMSGVLSYRYYKSFKGKIIDNNSISEVIVNMHVRPKNKRLNYDWVKLEQDLLSENLIIQFNQNDTSIKIIKIKDLYNFWIDKLNTDSLYFLDIKTKNWVEPLLQKYGRPFLITDFE